MPDGPQHTKCVLPANYEPLDVTAEVIVAIGGLVAAFLTAGVGAILTLGAMLSAFHKVVLYMLEGKLICLGGEVCAIGRISTFEEVGEDKPFPKNIDNDFCLNIILGPHDILDFDKDAEKNLKKAREGPQGKLIVIHPDMPADKLSSPGYTNSFLFDLVNMKFHQASQEEKENLPGELVQVPVLHCECEGSRINDVKNALEFFPGGGSKFCKKKKGGNVLDKVIGVAKGLVCKIVQTLFAPFVLIAVGNAWLGAKGGSSDDARQDPNSGTLVHGDIVLIRGRWVFDAAHGGYNEIHAVRTIQKLPPFFPSDFETFRNTACGLASAIPPSSGFDFRGPGVKPVGEPGKAEEGKPEGMTPKQEELWDRQRQPENRWIYHPAVDNCVPPPTTGKP